MELIFKHGWIFLIAMTIINGLVLKYRSKKYTLENPELTAGYAKIFRGLMIWGNIPWAIMAIGDLTQMTNNISEYSYPRMLNPMVLIFHAVIVVILIMGSKWIYLDNGAEFMAKHPGLIQFSVFGRSKDVTSSIAVKILWTLGLLGFIAAMIQMWTMRIPPMN